MDFMGDFKSIHIDLEEGIYLVNGIDIGNEPITRLNLGFFNGVWQLDYEKHLLGIDKEKQQRR